MKIKAVTVNDDGHSICSRSEDSLNENVRISVLRISEAADENLDASSVKSHRTTSIASSLVASFTDKRQIFKPKLSSFSITILLLVLVIVQRSVAVSPTTSSTGDALSIPSTIASTPSTPPSAPVDFYSFTVKTPGGRSFPLSKFRGKLTLAVNVASECGYTDDHYHEMVETSTIFKDYPFDILAFPCNQFGEQEPAPSRIVARFVKSYYKVKFPVFHKIAVKGPDADPAFRFLVAESGAEPTWNFWKYLVDASGHVIGAWGPDVKVFDLYNVIRDRLVGGEVGEGGSGDGEKGKEEDGESPGAESVTDESGKAIEQNVAERQEL